MTEKTQQFRAVRRPKDMESPYPIVVIDGQGLPHLPLTSFHFEIHQALADGTALTYTNVLLPYFTYLATDEWRQYRGDQWDSEPEAVQECVRDYLMYRLQCKVRRQDLYEVVSLTAKSPSTVRLFLAALKQFYSAMRRKKSYPFEHPLLDSTTRLIHDIDYLEGKTGDRRHPMPQRSGVEEPRQRYPSENYFRLAGEEWLPQPVADPDLPKLLTQKFTQAGLSLRDQIIIRIAYESGARIREILRLTVGDWRARSCNQEARTFSKGSRGRRVKVLRFGTETAKMLRAYMNTERKQWDVSQRRLEDLEETDSLFLSQRRKPYDYAAFIPNWEKLCQAAQLDLHVHQLRHWHVTAAMRLIAETATTSADITLRKEELVRYMAWRRPETLKAYEHYFQIQEYAKTQDLLLKRLYAHSSNTSPRRKKLAGDQQAALPDAQDAQDTLSSEVSASGDGWSDLLALGGVQRG